MSRRRRSDAFLPDLFMAGFEAQQVIGLRMMKLALGGAAAEREAALMVREKVEASLETAASATAAVMSGGAAGVPASTLAHYRRKMQANRRRLLKGD